MLTWTSRERLGRPIADAVAAANRDAPPVREDVHVGAHGDDPRQVETLVLPVQPFVARAARPPLSVLGTYAFRTLVL